MLYQNLFNKVVMVTGASSGLGEALARQFVDNSCAVYLGARSYSKLQKIAQEINNGRGIAIPIELDVTKPELVAEAAKRMVKEYGRIDVWVNNAGGEKPASILDLTPEQVYYNHELNYYGVVWGTQEAARQMVKQKEGDIVQILSTSAFTPRTNESTYCAAKAAAEMYSKCARLELQGYGIRFTHVLPGGIKSKFAESAGLQIPVNAMDPEEVADSILNALAKPRNIETEIRLCRKS